MWAPPVGPVPSGVLQLNPLVYHQSLLVSLQLMWAPLLVGDPVGVSVEVSTEGEDPNASVDVSTEGVSGVGDVLVGDPVGVSVEVSTEGEDPNASVDVSTDGASHLLQKLYYVLM